MNIVEAIRQVMKDAGNEPMTKKEKQVWVGILLLLGLGVGIGVERYWLQGTGELPTSKPAEVQLYDPTRLNSHTEMSRWHDPEYMVTCWGATPVNSVSGSEAGSAKAIYCMKDGDLVRRDPDCVPGTETQGKTIDGVEFPGVCVDKRNYR